MIDGITVICPFVFENEVQELKEYLGWSVPSYFKQDSKGLGSDIMYQTMWNECTPDDIFIMHSDMVPCKTDWIDQVLKYVKKYPEAGMFGCKLLYPEIENPEERYIQSAGGKFTEDGNPAHFGSGIDMFTGNRWGELEKDEGQYDKVREVAWTTFGGVYIRRSLLDKIGNFDPIYEWAYNRDVDYCLEARKQGFKIYQIPVAITHFESKDNKRIKQQNPELTQKEGRNLERLKNKWADSPLLKTLDKEIK